MGTQRTLRTKVLGSICLALVAASACLLWSSSGLENESEAVSTRRYVAAAHQSPKAVASSPICCNPQQISLSFADRLQAAGDIVFRHRVVHWGAKHTAALVLSVLVGAAAGTAQHRVSIYPSAIICGPNGLTRCFSSVSSQSRWSHTLTAACWRLYPAQTGSC